MAIDRFRGKYRFLSNFWPVSIKLSGYDFPSVENAYQAAKCKYTREIDQFQNLKPREAKRKGQSTILRDDWELVKIGIMLNLLRIKFKTSEALANQLLETSSLKLIEGNDWGDTFWGVCNGRGINMMGELLMAVRREIRHNTQFILHDEVAGMSDQDWQKLVERLKVKG